MAWMVGVDEAGYGPNLGPLVVAATAWRLAGGGLDVDLHQRLAAAVCREPRGDRIPIADSKALYASGGTLRGLERGLYAALAAGGEGAPRCWGDLAARLLVDPTDEAPPWRLAPDEPLPVDLDTDGSTADAAALAAALADQGIAAPLVRARVVQPREFNELIDRLGGKGAALSHVALGLARHVIDAAPGADPVCCVFDKHGGRNRYAAVVQHHFDGPVSVAEEARALSRYALSHGGRPVEFVFRVGGEAFLPTALASMAAKYLREVAMRGFNRYWSGRVAGLRPTAGYPGDAKRFRRDVESARVALGIEERSFWRCR